MISKSKVATFKKEETIYYDQYSIGLEPQELEITELSDKNYYRMIFKIITLLNKELETWERIRHYQKTQSRLEKESNRTFRNEHFSYWS